jgi:N4-(beta-N-acetylglucosaminyl)-L-asparaginase
MTDQNQLDRRSFIAAGAASVPALSALAAAKPETRPARGQAGPVVICSGNGRRAVDLAMARLNGGADPVEAVVDGVALVEDDPNDMTVGYGGRPNEDGVVELDASVMHGPTHKGGAVASLRNIRNPSRVALQVLRTTDHVLLVGEGALRFAKAHGFKEENLLTEKARLAWLRWKRNLNPNDDWLDEDQTVPLDPKEASARGETDFSYGTIHCAAVDANGDVGAVTTTSGLSWKIPGRVGDSPIIGAGMFVDNQVGAGGSTGRGESVIQSCASFQVVRNMAEGLDPTEACLKCLKWIADHTLRPELQNDRGEPNFNTVMYALRNDGAYGAACLRKGPRFRVHDGKEQRHEACAFLFE